MVNQEVEVDIESFTKNLKSENEQKFISFCMKFPNESLTFNGDYFLHNTSKAIFYGIRQIVEQNLHFDLDTLLVFTQEKFKTCTYELLEGIRDKFTEFENIEFVKVVIKNDHKRFHLNTRIFKELWPKAVQADLLTNDQIIKFAESLLHEANDGNSHLLTTEQLVAEHKKVIEDRDFGILQRSLGFSKLDKNLTRPGAPEEISIIAANKGAGKSVFCKHIENLLINRGVCVVSFNLEMSQASNMDRLLCIRNGFTLGSLNQQNMEPEFKAKIMRALDDIGTIPNYIYSPLETMTLSDLDSALYQADAIFASRGVLPKDRYKLIAIDSLDMIQGFNDPQEIKRNIDVFARIIRKHKSHAIPLLQFNEDKLRGKHFSDPEDIDRIKYTYTDIYGGSYYAARARVVITLNRPKQLRMQLFPEQEEKWKLENDILQVVISKQNDGAVSGYLNFLFDGPGMRITQMN